MISEDKKVILTELVNALEHELSGFIHNIEEDESIPLDSWLFLDNQSNKLYELIRLLQEEIYFS
jgi:hypothetical protein